MDSEGASQLTSKIRRHQAIRRLVATGGVRTQDDLVTGLARSGFRVTQATVSRDVEELGLVRVRLPNRGMIYALPEAPLTAGTAPTEDEVARLRLARLLTEVPVEIVDAEAFFLVRTAPGTANLLAAALDASAYPDVAGTVAGDDTFLVAVRSRAAIDPVRALLGGNPAVPQVDSEDLEE